MVRVMPVDQVCPQCGKRIPPAETACPYCAAGRGFPRLGRTPLTLALLLALIAGLWALTRYFTDGLSHRRQELAHEWFDRGQGDLARQYTGRAVDDFRTALVYSPDSAPFRLRLAEALAQGQQIRQAQAYLLALWDEQPGNATVNLELARLAARSGQIQDAVRYFHGAIYGEWETDSSVRRRDTRLELIRFLLDHHEVTQAESELIALAADLPPDPHLLDLVAGLFVEAKVDRRALDQYQRALRLDSKDPAALLGAGRAAFALGLYADAERYLKRAVEREPDNAQAKSLLETASLTQELNPYQPHLSLGERVQRTLEIFRTAEQRARQCAQSRGEDLLQKPPATDLAAGYSRARDLQKRMLARELRRDPELVDAAADVAFQLEQEAAQQCGTPSGADLAVLLLSHQNAAGGQSSGGQSQ